MSERIYPELDACGLAQDHTAIDNANESKRDGSGDRSLDESDGSGDRSLDESDGSGDRSLDESDAPDFSQSTGTTTPCPLIRPAISKARARKTGSATAGKKSGPAGKKSGPMHDSRSESDTPYASAEPGASKRCDNTDHSNMSNLKCTAIRCLSADGRIKPIYGFIVMLIIALILSIITYLLVYWPTTPKALPAPPDVDRFQTSLSASREHFRAQDPLLWKTARLATEPLFGEPTKPGVVLLVTTSQSRAVGHCIAKHVAGAFARSGVAAEAAPLADAPVDDMRAALHARLRASLLDERIAVVLDVDRLPARVVEVLQGVCDDQNAPYKTALVVLTVTAPAAVRDEQRLHRFLMQLWGDDLTDENAAAIISRITGFVAFVNDELLPSAAQC